MGESIKPKDGVRVCPCGFRFIPVGKEIFCPICRVERGKKQKREWARKNVEITREYWDKWYAENLKVPPETDIMCHQCGTLFVAKSKRSKFCTECKLERKRERNRKWKLENQEKVREQKRRARNK